MAKIFLANQKVGKMLWSFRPALNRYEESSIIIQAYRFNSDINNNNYFCKID